MPNIKSAKKRVSVIERRKQENRYVKSTMATMIKKFREAVKYDVAEAEAMLKEVVSYIDSAETKGVIHKNNASRKISRLNSLLFKAKNNASKVEEKVEVAEAKVEEEKTEAPKTEEKPAKKTATKKVEEKPAKETKAKKSAKKDAE